MHCAGDWSTTLHVMKPLLFVAGLSFALAACGTTSEQVQNRTVLDVFAEQMRGQGLEPLRPARSEKTFDAGWILRPGGIGGSPAWEYCGRPALRIRSSAGVSGLRSYASVAVEQKRSVAGPNTPMLKLSDAFESARKENVKVTLRDTQVRAAPNADIRDIIENCPHIPWDGDKIEFVQEVLVGSFDLEFQGQFTAAGSLDVGNILFEAETRRRARGRSGGKYTSTEPIVIGYKRDCVERKGWDVLGVDELSIELGIAGMIVGGIFGVFAFQANQDYNDRCDLLGGVCGGDRVAEDFQSTFRQNLVVASIVGGLGVLATAFGTTRHLLPSCPAP